MGQSTGEDRPEGSDADRAADGAGEADGGGGDADVFGWCLVLYGEQENLHGHPDADADDGHVDAGLGSAAVDVEGGHEEDADGYEGHATGGEEPVPSGATDDLSGHDGRANDAEHQRRDEQSRVARRRTVRDLKKRRQIRDYAEHGDAHGQADGRRHVEGSESEEWKGQHRLIGS